MSLTAAMLKFSDKLPGRWPRLALGAVLLLGMFAQVAAAQTIDARVLHINSYHRGYSWSDGIEQGLRDRFAASGKNIEISVEYLDSRRFTYGAQIEPLAAAMAIKYASYRPDLVVVSDNAAFDFAIRNRQRLFPGLPIVFCGYNNFRPEVIQGIGNITGVNEEISIDNTVEMALKVHPATRTLVFVTSTGEASSKRISEVAEAAVFPKYRNRFNLVVLKDASLAEIRERLAQVPRDSLVFLSGQTRDPGAGRELTPVENGRLISAASPLPVYTFWDFHLGTGVLGGHILTGPDQGRTAADLALRILGGTRADDIPVVMTSPTSDIFDYPVMQRFHIEPAALPPNSVILNRPVTLWETYRWQIAATLFLVVIETLLIFALVRAMRQRKQALAALEKEQAQLERKVEERTCELHASETRLKHLNETLDQRVKEEVAKNLAQEKLLIQQSRQAAMGQMIGNIAHQWRQPLNTLGLLLENLKDANEFHELDKATIDKSVATGRQLIQTMATTIDDFRNFFKPNKEKTCFDLGNAIEKTRNILGDTLQNRNIAVSVVPAPEIRVNGYLNELTQVLLNVVNNAGDALLERQVAGGKIEITRGCDGDTAWIAVKDNGGGIPADILPKIFDPYFTTKASGTGIGLYMSRMIMEHMDGAITAHNLGDGMEFRIALPAQ